MLLKILAFAAPLVPREEVLEQPAGDGWWDISGGRSRCWMRKLSTALENKRPWRGCVCQVSWTAWLARGTGAGYIPADRMGVLQPNATMEFTLGGGAAESSLAWDAAVKEMAKGDRVEIFAMPEFAFGSRAVEPHLPANSRIFFELTLDSFSDWAEGNYDVIDGVDSAWTDDYTPDLKEELNKAAAKKENQNLPPETTLIDDVMAKEDDDDEIPAHEEPRFGSLDDGPAIPVDGSGKGYVWYENAYELELRVDVPYPITKDDVRVDFRSTHLSIVVHGQPLLEGTLAGAIAPDASTWAVADDARSIEINLIKQKRRRLFADQGKPTMADIWATVFNKTSTTTS